MFLCDNYQIKTFIFSIVSLKMSCSHQTLPDLYSMLVLIQRHFSSSPHTFVPSEVTFLANQINVCSDKAAFIRPPLLGASLTRVCVSSAFFCSYLCSPRMFVSAERGQKCKGPRNHLSGHFHSRRSLFGDTVCGDSGPGVAWMTLFTVWDRNESVICRAGGKNADLLLTQD